MDRPKRKVATVDYKKFNNFGTSGIDDMAFEYIFQKMADSNSDRDELQLHAEEDDILDLMSDDESNKLNEAAAFIYTTPHKTKNKESDELKKHESDEDLELRIKLLEEKKQRLKRDQLNKRIKELEAEVDGMSKLEEMPKKKSKKSKGEITLTNLRANDKLNKDVNDEMKRLGLDFDTNFSGQSELAETSKDKNVKFKSEKVTSEQELLQQLKKLNLAKGSVSKTNQHRRKHSDSKSQKVVQLPESVLRGNSSTESESETSSTSSSEDSSDYELSAKLSSKKKSKKLKSGLKIKSADKVINPQFFPHNFLQYEYEVGYGAVLGPFASNPFNDHLVISPLNSVPKANSEERRVIMDLSFPKGKSVNDGIDKNVYLGKHVELHYPNVDNFIEIIKEKGEFCKIFKRDLRRAYRQIPVDPKDYNLIGFSWKGHYFVDRVLPMGLKSSAFICQTVTNAVRFIAKNHDISLINYLDDFAGAEISEKADISYKKIEMGFR
ncbi:unnamed protein product [Mytilus coruscus]|uniref:Reverse transcriptase domain-containing protein n=1 Tax=Mytilus coruscus TaxID=42192 RepID=A0A6J8CBH3_MYTCO|nr:unnamed protein product [Mytilus coruscus]